MIDRGVLDLLSFAEIGGMELLTGAATHRIVSTDTDGGTLVFFLDKQHQNQGQMFALHLAIEDIRCPAVMIGPVTA